MDYKNITPIKEKLIEEFFNGEVPHVYMRDKKMPSGVVQVGIMVSNFYDTEGNLQCSCALVRNGIDDNFVIGATQKEINPRDIERLASIIPKIKGEKRPLDKDEFIFRAKNLEIAQVRMYERIYNLLEIVADSNSYFSLTTPQLKPKGVYEAIRTEALKSAIRENGTFATIAKSLFEWNKQKRGGKHLSSKYIKEWAEETGQPKLVVEKQEASLIVLCNEFKSASSWKSVQYQAQQTLSLFGEEYDTIATAPATRRKKRTTKISIPEQQEQWEQISLF